MRHWGWSHKKGSWQNSWFLFSLPKSKIQSWFFTLPAWLKSITIFRSHNISNTKASLPVKGEHLTFSIIPLETRSTWMQFGYMAIWLAGEFQAGFILMQYDHWFQCPKIQMVYYHRDSASSFWIPLAFKKIGFSAFDFKWMYRSSFDFQPIEQLFLNCHFRIGKLTHCPEIQTHFIQAWSLSFQSKKARRNLIVFSPSTFIQSRQAMPTLLHKKSKSGVISIHDELVLAPKDRTSLSNLCNSVFSYHMNRVWLRFYPNPDCSHSFLFS